MKDWLKLIEPHPLIQQIPSEQAARIHQRSARELGRRGRGTLIPYLFLVVFMLVMSAEIREDLIWTGPLCIGLLATSIARFLIAKSLLHVGTRFLEEKLGLYAYLSLFSSSLLGVFASYSLVSSGFSSTSMLLLLASCGVTGAAIGTIAMYPRTWMLFIAGAWAPVMLTCCVQAVSGVTEAISLLFMTIFYVGFVNAVGIRTIESYWQGQINLLQLEQKTVDLKQTLDLLEEKEVELREHHDHLQDQVRTRTEDLLEAKNEAERANESKSEFVSNMTHELRTPMHAILSFSRFGLKRFETEPREKLGKYFSRIEESGSRLLSLVDDVLDLSKFEASSMPMRFSSSQINELIQSRVNELEAKLIEANLKINLELDESDPNAYVDPMFIGQVVSNLLSNAIKFSPEQGSILVRTRQTHMAVGRRTGDPDNIPAVEILVRDQGIGVPEDELESIFDKFSQSSRSRTGAGGTGLGLAICREIVEAHRGKIWAESEAGQGTDMYVQIVQDMTELPMQLAAKKSGIRLSELQELPPGEKQKKLHPFTRHADSELIKVEKELAVEEHA